MGLFIPGVLNNVTATVAPTAAADSSLGYAAGSLWIRASGLGAIWQCLSAVVGSAVWQRIGGDITTISGGTGYTPSVTDDANSGYTPGSIILSGAGTTAVFWQCTSAVVGAADWKRLSNFRDTVSASSDPTSGTDEVQGYRTGSLWTRTDTGAIWFCVSGATAAAVWKRLDNLATSGAQFDRQFATVSGTWTKPAWAAAVPSAITTVIMMGSGGGGGAGRRGIIATARIGGGGGAGGGFAVKRFLTSSLGATETFTIVAAGTGAVATATDDTTGANGGNGGNTVFGATQRAMAGGGNGGGGGGQGTGGTGGSVFNGGNGGAGASASGSGGGGVNGSVAAFLAGAPGGSSGAGLSTTNVENSGGNGGFPVNNWQNPSGAAAPGAGQTSSNGASVLAGSAEPGQAGSGGSSSATGIANAGSNGGNYGAGGAGGGASTNGNASGAGGNGGGGCILIITEGQ